MTSPQNISLGNRHFDELDSLRGLAAITVALGHLALLTFASPNWPSHPRILFWQHVVKLLNRTPLAFLMGGGSAVRFFFVLSGFVLMLPFLRRKSNPYSTYIVKRFCRLYLPYIAAVLLGLLGDYLLGQGSPRGFPPPVHPGGMWGAKITWRTIIDNVFMFGHQVGSVDEVLWSLVQEMRISIFYPLIVWLVLSVDTGILVLVVGGVEIFIACLAVFIPGIDMSLQSFPSTLHFAMFFILGAALAKNHEALGERLKKLSLFSRVALAFVAFMAYSMGIKLLWGYQFLVHVILPFQHRFPHRWFAQPAFDGFVTNAAGDWIAALCAAIAILYALHQVKIKAILHYYPILITGRASYTLYLVHTIVLWTLLYGLYGTPFEWLIVPGFVFGTILLTWAFYQWVEVPTRDLGRIVAKRMLTKQREKASTPTAP